MVDPTDVVETVIAVFLGAVVVLTVWNAVFELEISGLIGTLLVDGFVIALMIAIGAAIFLTVIRSILD